MGSTFVEVKAIGIVSTAGGDDRYLSSQIGLLQALRPLASTMVTRTYGDFSGSGSWASNSTIEVSCPRRKVAPSPLMTMSSMGEQETRMVSPSISMSWNSGPVEA